MKKDVRNITLALPADMLRRAKILAVNRGTSLSGLLRGLLDDLLSREEGYSRAMHRNLRTLKAGTNLGTRGRSRWRREELHER